MTETDNIKSKAKLIDSTVFDAFKTITSAVDKERYNGSLTLLKHLSKNENIEKVSDVLLHNLKNNEILKQAFF